jgi:hypothetical protein
MTASANPRYRLAPRTRSQQSAPSMRNGFKTTFAAIRERRDCGPLIQLLTGFHLQRRRTPCPKAFSQPRNRIQYP